MDWFFPSNNGGQESGFNDAGVVTFKGNIDRYLAREAIQISLDAAANHLKPVRVAFELQHHKPGSLPGIAVLRQTMKSCGDYFPKDKKAKNFFANASELLKSGSLPVLRIGDYNTTGVTGADDDREGNWYNLVKCAGSSAKGEGEGGSFGIGK